jgi:hypothetical protein
MQILKMYIKHSKRTVADKKEPTEREASVGNAWHIVIFRIIITNAVHL